MASSAHQAAFAHFQARFEAMAGCLPVFRGKADGDGTRRLVRQFSEAEVLRRIDAFFDLPGTWWKVRQAWGFNVFLSASVQNDLSVRLAMVPRSAGYCDTHEPPCPDSRQHARLTVNAQRVAQGLAPYTWKD